MTFIARALKFVLEYGTGQKGDGAPRKIELTGHRAAVNVNVAGGIGMGMLQARIWGMPFHTMNDVTTIGSLPTLYRRNTVTLSAGDADQGLAQIFEGTIVAAWADMAAAPSVAFNITAAAGLIEQVAPTTPTSYPGAADAAQIMADLAGKAGLKFVNHGVAGVMLSSQYLWGSARDQMLQCMQACSGSIEWIIENGTVSIWPTKSYRDPKGLVPLISVDTGMVGYPSYTATGLMVRSIFNPDVRFGALVEIKSSFQNSLGGSPVNGRWRVVSLVHQLEPNMPGGQWFTDMQLAAPESVVVVQ